MLIIADLLKVSTFYLTLIWLATGTNFKILRLYKGYYILVAGFIFLSLNGSLEFLSTHSSFFLLRSISIIISLGYICSLCIIFAGFIVLIHSFKKLHFIDAKYKESLLKLDAIFNYSTNCISLVKPDGTISITNKKVLIKFFPTHEKKTKIWEIPCFNNKDYQDIIKNHINFALAHNVTEEIFNLQDVNKNNVIMKIIFTPILDERETLQYILMEGIDITDLENSFRELAQIQKMETIGTMAGGIAHDLNNMLSGITGSLSILDNLFQEKKNFTSEELEEHLNIIRHSNNRMSYLINQFLKLAHTDTISKEVINLKEIAEHILSMAKTNFDKSITFATQFPEEECFIYSSADLIEQSLLNILINAGQAMTTMRKDEAEMGGKISLKIIKRTFLDESYIPVESLKPGLYWEIEISDTGVGMDSHTLKKIFDPFFTTKKNEGLGLGLAMAYKIIKQSNGAIKVYSEEGIGTTFHIYFPFYREPIRRSKAIRPEISVKGSGTILLVDDENIILKVGKTILEKAGYKVIIASNGKEAIEIYKEKKNFIDLVLLDMIMPELSGLQVFEKLFSINNNVKVILTSGIETDIRIQKMMDAGAKGFLKKPFSAYEITKIVKTVLNPEE